MELSLLFFSAGQIYPICIDLNPTEKREVENANTLDAYGWGKTRTANISEILQRVTLQHYNPRRCNRIARAPLTLNQICAGSLDRDTCKGDSGGPLIQKLNYNGTRHLTQLGIVSYGSESCKGLGVYTDVTSYAEWIDEQIKALFSKYSRQSSPTAISLRPPTETSVFRAENFGQARLLFEPCGTSLSTRIVNGENAEPEAAAWMAGIHSNETGFVCGGTVIHRRFVLTAAHCLIDRQEENLIVKLGAYDIRRPTLVYSVSNKIIHNEFELIQKIHNIGLLQLSRDIEFSRHVYPICIIRNLEAKRKVESANTFDTYGWGRTNKRQLSNILQKVTVDRYDRSNCESVFFSLHSSHICAGASVRGPCNGDSGGPLTKKVIINGLQRKTQFGILSGGTSSNCYGNGIYTDVTSYVDWIVRKVRGLRTTI
ncbi:granzyme M-like [Drosophila kikkawai]|uniref:Granzyme M-like n=1 Tax=Drosophila kikkawai TaxID=30033 RepID=A0ABM4GCP3_DROKI